MKRFVQPNAYHQIGIIRKIKGMNGLMIVHLNYIDVQWNPTLVYLYQHYTYVPYLVSSWQEKNDFAQLHLTDVTRRSEAMSLHGIPLFLPADIVEKNLTKTLHCLIGYRIIDKIHGVLGEVIEVEPGLQSRCCVEYNSQRLWVPLQEGRTVIDHAERTIFTQLPPDYLIQSLSV